LVAVRASSGFLGLKHNPCCLRICADVRRRECLSPLEGSCGLLSQELLQFFTERISCAVSRLLSRPFSYHLPRSPLAFCFFPPLGSYSPRFFFPKFEQNKQTLAAERWLPCFFSEGPFYCPPFRFATADKIFFSRGTPQFRLFFDPPPPPPAPICVTSSLLPGPPPDFLL